MYMQTDRPILPKNYSGSAFALPTEAPPPSEPPAPPSTEEAPPVQEPRPSAEAVAVNAAPAGGRGGLLSKFPMLSTLLPPPRRGESEARRLPLPDWALLGAVALLFLADEGNDILPFLLLLLLWD